MITQLPEAVLELFDASISANTKRAYATALHRLQIYLNGKPVTDAALATYLTDLFHQGRAPATVAMVIAAVRLQARLYGNKKSSWPGNRGTTGRAQAPRWQRGTGQVKGARWEQADATVVDQSLRAWRDAAIITIASDAMLRISALSALLLSDLSIEAVDGSGRLLIQKSKTGQEQKGKHLYLGKPTVGHIQSWIAPAVLPMPL